MLIVLAFKKAIYKYVCICRNHKTIIIVNTIYKHYAVVVSIYASKVKNSIDEYRSLNIKRYVVLNIKRTWF